VTRRRAYPSDASDAEWAILQPLLPVPACRTRRGGRPETHDRRDIVDAIRYVVDNGIKWRALPHEYPPWQTVYGFFQRWARAGVVAALRDQLRERIRRRMGRCPNAVTAVLDSQNVKAAETASKETRGYDGAKRVNGRKRHLVVDTKGLPLTVLVTAADLTDRDAAREVLIRLRLLHPEITLLWADSAYSGELVEWAKKNLRMTIKISKRPPGASGFVVVPRRWVVERTLSWIMRARRNCRDYERLVQHAEAHITWSMVTLMTRRLARGYIQPESYPSAAVLAAAA
jgi:transposase